MDYTTSTPTDAQINAQYARQPRHCPSCDEVVGTTIAGLCPTCYKSANNIAETSTRRSAR